MDILHFDEFTNRNIYYWLTMSDNSPLGWSTHFLELRSCGGRKSCYSHLTVALPRLQGEAAEPESGVSNPPSRVRRTLCSDLLGVDPSQRLSEGLPGPPVRGRPNLHERLHSGCVTPPPPLSYVTDVSHRDTQQLVPVLSGRRLSV